MEAILNTYPVGILKREISKTNIKNYSKLKKAEVIKLMVNAELQFRHLTKNTTYRKQFPADKSRQSANHATPQKIKEKVKIMVIKPKAEYNTKKALMRAIERIQKLGPKKTAEQATELTRLLKLKTKRFGSDTKLPSTSDKMLSLFNGRVTESKLLRSITAFETLRKKKPLTTKQENHLEDLNAELAKHGLRIPEKK
jgi:hypothetical protein